MYGSLRTKLMAIVASAAFALLAIVVASLLSANVSDAQVHLIQERLLPKVGLRPLIEAQFERLRRGCQDAVAAKDPDLLDGTRSMADAIVAQFAAARDAVAAKDPDLLDGTRSMADAIVAQFAAARDAVDPADAGAAARAVEDYYVMARNISRRLIAGETGEEIVRDMAAMQQRQMTAEQKLAKATAFDRHEISGAFEAVSRARQWAMKVRLGVSAVCLLLVIVLSTSIGRSVLHSVRDVTAGLQRFGAGDFATPIPTTSQDELAEVARQANRMAESLDRLGAERERHSAELEQKNAALNEVRMHLEHQAQELTTASAYKSQFLANMSHELRTPLNAILGFAELLESGEVPPESPQYMEFLGDIRISGKHLLQLISDILDLTKVEAGRLDFHPEPIRPELLLSGVISVLKANATTKGLVVESSVDPGLGELVLDPARIKQVLYNYLSNAIKFTPPGGRIWVRALPEGADRVRFDVEDTGIGIAEKDISRLFVEFQQLDSTAARHVAGTGLGLALTRRLVEAQSGTVGVRSELGKGSTFFAILPRRSPVGTAAEHTPPLLPVLAAPDAPMILVIEDDSHDQEQLIHALAGAGYGVEVAGTGARAIELCSKRKFAGITLDLLLPDIGGIEVLQKIRKQGLNRDVPVVVITLVAERGAIAGFAVQDFLHKPVHAQTLRESLERAGVRPGVRSKVLLVDDDAIALKLMRTGLEHLGFDVLCETVSSRGLALALAHPPAAIVLDLMMPGLDGFAFLDGLRSDPEGRRVPVIVWTGMDLSNEQVERLRASAQAIVAKGSGGASAVAAELQAFLRASTKGDEAWPAKAS